MQRGPSGRARDARVGTHRLLIHVLTAGHVDLGDTSVGRAPRWRVRGRF